MHGHLNVKLREREHLEDLSGDRRMILKYNFKKWEGGMDLFDLFHYTERWRAVVIAVTKFGFHKMWGISCLT